MPPRAGQEGSDSSPAQDTLRRRTRRVRVRPIDVVDVFVYLVVLGTFIQVFPAVISESFLVALLTAVLLKAVLEVVLLVKKRIVARIRGDHGPWIRILNVGMLVLALPASKFVVLEFVNLAFGDAASLGGLLSVTLLIVVLMLSRRGVRRLLAPRTTR